MAFQWSALGTVFDLRGLGINQRGVGEALVEVGCGVVETNATFLYTITVARTLALYFTCEMSDGGRKSYNLFNWGPAATITPPRNATLVYSFFC